MTTYFVRNLVGLLLVGVGILAWVLSYTDWFPAVGGVLALGGALSWLAFVSRILKNERLEQLQDWADVKIFNNPRTQWCVLAVGLSALVLTFFVGTLELCSEPGASLPRSVLIHRGDVSKATSNTLSGTLRVPLLTALWAPARVHVKLSGYPELAANVWPWSHTTLSAPDQFLRPVLVVKPDKDLLDMLANNPMVLALRLASQPGHAYRLEGYHGETVWLGCDEDVDVPPQLLESWKSDLTARGQSQHLHLWSHPLAIPNGPQALASGERLTVELLSGPQRVYAQATATVRAIRTRRDFPQEEEIHGLPSASVPPAP